MTNFDNIKYLSLEGFAGWLADTFEYDDQAPWNVWFDKEYCNRCETFEVPYKVAEDKLGISSFGYSGTVTCGYCELYNKCRYFPDMDAQPTPEEVITMWLRRDMDDD